MSDTKKALSADLEQVQRALDQATFENVKLRAAMAEACDLLMEKTHGNHAMSAGHNARLTLEAALRQLK